MPPVQFHPAVEPIRWLVGKWKSTKAVGDFPTIKPFTYNEEMEFESLGQPLLNYQSKTCHPVANNPMHLESGFLRINPGTSNVAFMVSHNFGLVSLEEGTVVDNNLNLKSTHIGRMSFAKDPAVTEIARSFVYSPNDKKLHITVLMATSNTELHQHLVVEYEKL
ncbi:hypothetical protein PPYR_01273 [Photinus pyralis]|uniref:THAP4-like heme-binding domain-containing protein n=1 Tax=Photinus pyralis TaxID=7054 RepID=A0A1Y1LC58_PHOPY|nr:THAP domain-containing protein 4-like [Photinus pyralis]KAB0804303.1 hypothetical protein PPYR_01273 [Photinus pyralis]